jgi:hypothetical protein
MHNIAALRALVDPTWLPKIFLPYDGLLTHGRVVRDRAVLVDSHRVVTASGQEFAADYIVLATGSRYPFPAKTDLVDTRKAHEEVRRVHQALSEADRVLLVGAGPVGIELAGEIRHVWPDKTIVLLDVADEVLGGPFKSELKAELRHQLAEFRVEVLLGSPLRTPPPTEPGEPGTFTVTTEGGTEITADIWFRCYGVFPNRDYLGEALKPARRPDGFMEVTPPPSGRPDNRLCHRGPLHRGRQDPRPSPRAKPLSWPTTSTGLARGRTDLADYQSMGVAIAVPIGPTGGAGQFPGQDEIVGREVISELKGRHMGVDRFTELFGLAAAGDN